MANHAAGDRTVLIDGDEYTLRFSFGAMAAIEGDFGGRPIFQILNDDLASGSVTAIARIFHRMLEAGGHKLSFNAAGELLLIADFDKVADALADCIAASLGGEEAPGKPNQPKGPSAGAKSIKVQP